VSAAIAGLMPQVGDLARAVEEAKAYVSAAIAASARIEIGTGIGPVHHFHRWW
jgi:hydroxymethylpyrimidine/phosphomethylpyrimidine kinase